MSRRSRSGRNAGVRLIASGVACLYFLVGFGLSRFETNYSMRRGGWHERVLTLSLKWRSTNNIEFSIRNKLERDKDLACSGTRTSLIVQCVYCSVADLSTRENDFVRYACCSVVSVPFGDTNLPRHSSLNRPASDNAGSHRPKRILRNRELDDWRGRLMQ